MSLIIDPRLWYNHLFTFPMIGQYTTRSDGVEKRSSIVVWYYKMDISGKVFFITGSAQGIGMAYVDAVLNKGGKVIIFLKC